MIYLGADHRGYKAKEALRAYLATRGYNISDEGTDSEEAVDYPQIAEKVCRKVIEDPNNRGILFCGSGVGVCIAANKIRGIRAGQAFTEEIARVSRNDDNINVLCLAADSLSIDEQKKISQVFLDSSFGGEERYNRRLKQIKDLEG